MKRGLFSEKETQLVHTIEKEFELFKYQMLARSRKKIFEGCWEIRFYSCIYEYFLYAEDIAEAHINACLKCESVIAQLYELYLKCEYLRCDRWEDIEELLDVFAARQEEGDCSMELQRDNEKPAFQSEDFQV